MYKNLLFILMIFIFSGCATKIDFKKFDTQEYIENKDIEYKKKPNLELSNIGASTSQFALINNDNFINHISFNEYYYSIFNTSNQTVSSNIKLELRLVDLGYAVEFIPARPYEYKGKTRYTDSYYDVTVYSHIKAKLTKPDGSIEVFEDQSSYSHREDVEYFYGWGRVYAPKYLYNDVLQNNLNDIFIIARNKLSNPFTVTKVLKEIKPEKGKYSKYALAVNGGTCDGLYGGQRASVYHNSTLIGYGEVTSQTSCKNGWVLIEDVYSITSVYDQVIIRF